MYAYQVLLARGLQLEKTSKVANVQYIEVCYFIFLIGRGKSSTKHY